MYKCYSQLETLYNYTQKLYSVPSVRLVEGTEWQVLVKDKRMTNAHKGRDHNTTYLCLHLNSCTIMHVCVK